MTEIDQIFSDCVTRYREEILQAQIKPLIFAIKNNFEDVEERLYLNLNQELVDESMVLDYCNGDKENFVRFFLKKRFSSESKDNPQNFYKSDQWRRIRFDVLKQCGRRCQLCGAKNVELHVDHIKPRSLFPALELNPNNLQVLCKDCNLGKGNRDTTDFRWET